MLNSIKPTASVEPIQHPDPVGFLADTYEFFQHVSQKVGGALNQFYNVHGHLIQLSFAGPALTRITPALAHWAVEKPAGRPALTIHLWDDASTGTKMPPPPWLGYGVRASNGGLQGVYGKRGEVRGFNTDRIRTIFQWGSNVLSIVDIQHGQAIFWTRDAAQLPQWEIGSPLRNILHLWLHEQGLQYVHAGAVGTPAGGVLLVGKGGSGKSTTALTCLNSDLVYVSDDYCLVSPDPAPMALNLYNTGKVRADNIHRVPHLAPVISNVDKLDQDKALFFLHRFMPGKLATGFPLKAILIPRVTGRVDTTLTPAPAMTGLSALTLSTVHQLPGAGPAALQLIKRLTDQLPCYYLELGTDLAQIPRVIKAMVID
ncbi:MAG: serine kinase [Anaerolineales bacterium]|nr:serine kinase [Anaerolineales bacterium]